jgi:light-regulated signal transduction histidine kinase (bacteriophytochrome)
MARALANRASLAVYNANLFNGAKAEIKQRKKLQKELERLNEALETRVKQRTKQLEKTNKGLSDEIVQRHKAEAALQEYSTSLSRSNQELQDFAYVASHDLQEPLRKIRAFGDILESEYSEQLGDGVEYLQRMQNAASRMSILIEDLLAFSRVSTKQPANDMVDLNSIAHDVIGDLEAQIERTGGTVTIEGLPSIKADGTHMRQLFQNLIGNALKFRREGVPPVVKVYMCAEDKANGLQTICIEDNGIGFDEKYLDRIFSVFQRLHSRDNYEGTGIGLAVVRKIAERYGGTITASSKKGVGSTFKVTFPMIKKENKA